MYLLEMNLGILNITNICIFWRSYPQLLLGDVKDQDMHQPLLLECEVIDGAVQAASSSL